MKKKHQILILSCLVFIVSLIGCKKEDDNTVHCFECLTKIITEDYVLNDISERYDTLSHCNWTSNEAKNFELKRTRTFAIYGDPAMGIKTELTRCRRR